jgi:hypothetical protein
VTTKFDELDAQALVEREGQLLLPDERVAYERRYAEVNPRWNRVPKARREYLDELCERHRDGDGMMACLLRGD